MMRGELVTLSTSIGSAAPPGEFQIFAAGWNDSRKGRVLFDSQAAADVMAAYRQHGADIMLDLEHLSLNDEAPNFDPDARGWCKLELRGGALWAVRVSWTADGAERIRTKKQRYISPAFYVDTKTRRIVEIKNVAITSLPASDNLTALVAASNRITGEMMNTSKIELTPEDRKICRLTGRNPADLLAFKRAEAANAPRPAERSTGVELTDEDREICRLTGRDPKVFLAHKKNEAALAVQGN